MNAQTNLMSTFDRFQEFIKQPENQRSIPIKIQQKLSLLQSSLIDPHLIPDPVDYDQLQTEELKTLSNLNIEAKTQIYLNIVGTFMRLTTVVGKLDMLGRSTIIWSEKTLELDLDLKQLKIGRNSKNEPPHVINMRIYRMKFGGFNRNRFQIVLNTDNPQAQFKEIIFGSEVKEGINQWWEHFKACIEDDKQQVEERQRLKTMAASTIVSHRKYSDIQHNERPDTRSKNMTIAQFSKTNIIDIEALKKPIIQKQTSQSEQKQSQPMMAQTSPMKQQLHIVQTAQQLPSIFDELKDKLNYNYFVNEDGFELLEFDQCARIMQHTTNQNHFRVFVSLPKVPLELLITGLYDSYAQMKWNQEIIKQTTILQPSSTLAQIEESRKPFNYVYYPRFFKYLRYIYTQPDQFYIIEKSCDHDTKSGQIEWSITAVFITNSESRLMIHDTLTYNNGFITKGQDVQLTLRYLRQYAHFKQYLKEEHRKNIIQDGSQPIYIKEVMQQLQQYHAQNQPQNILIHETNSTVSEDELVKDPFIYEDIRIEEEKSQIVTYSESEDDQLTISNFTETYEQYLKRLLAEVTKGRHHSTQLHTYNIKCQDTMCNDRYSITQDGLHFFYKDEWVYDQIKGSLKFVNQKKLDEQKKVFLYILSKIGSNLIQGKSILNISLPVYVFEKRSNLQRFSASFAYAPHFLEPAAHQSPLEQMKAVIAFAFSTTILFLNLDKPFNPILGETHQCWIKGSPVYVEQISHHPPIAAFQMYGRGYKMYGHYETYAKMSPNNIVGGNLGWITVEFEKGSKIQFIMPKGCVNGITFGDRTFYTDGNQWFVDCINNQVADITVNPNQGFFGSPTDAIVGYIYKVDNQEIEKWKKQSYKEYPGLKGVKQHHHTILTKITGNWASRGNNILYDGMVSFDIMKDFPFMVIPQNEPMASDSSYREDLIAWQMNNFDLAMERKEKLEIIQRSDQKQRDSKHK